MQTPPIQYTGPVVAKPKASGLAITALVLGIVAMVPCLTIICAPLAVVFGIVSLVDAKKKGKPRGMALAGTILGSVGLVALIGLFVVGIVASKPKPFQAEEPSYHTLVGEGFSGAGFHFRHGGESYLACSLHQFDEKTPSFLLAPDLETKIPVTGRYHSQSDVQVLTYDQGSYPEVSPLECEAKPFLTAGDPVFLLLDDKVVRAHVTRRSFLEGVWFESKTPFRGPGSSGSPVVSGVTGKVVGVMLGGTMEEGTDGEITEGYFEELKMP